MRWAFTLFIFLSSHGLAQYEQVVKPVRVDEIISFTTYQLRQALNDFIKQSSNQFLQSSSQLTVQAQMSCAISQAKIHLSELSISRTEITPGPYGLQIRESLYLKSCNRRIELFVVERHGAEIAASSDADLLKGLIPGSKGLSFYRLYLLDRKNKFEIVFGPKTQKLEMSMALNDNGSSIQLQLIESLPEQTLTSQAFRLTVFENGRLNEDVGGQYLWNIAADNGTPKQYFFIREKEVIPSVFLKAKDSIFNKTIYPLLQNQLQFQKVVL